MMLPVVVSYYTVGTPYEAMAERLRASCNRVGLTHDIIPIDSLGSWELNTAAKARICRDAWEQLGVVPILWVDADAVFHAPPELLRDTDADVAVHKWKGQYLASGTVFFNQTQLAGVLLDYWVKRCEDGKSDQHHLQEAWEALPHLKTLWLPRSYCQIFDAPREGDEPVVIEHFQASREQKSVKALS